MWPWDERIDRALQGYRGFLLQETIERWKTPEERQFEYLIEYLPKVLKHYLNIVAVSIINIIGRTNPFVKGWRDKTTIFREKQEGEVDGEIRIVNGQKYRIVE